ncbi:MAG: hypothetical protein H0X62_05310 [Bacteroidetes bacterium]|nr:hypothetical protein [Bacteroidota bacterium]
MEKLINKKHGANRFPVIVPLPNPGFFTNSDSRKLVSRMIPLEALGWLN